MDLLIAAGAAILDFQSEQFWRCLIYKRPKYFLPSFKSTGLLVHEKKLKIDFQDGRHGGNLGFLIEKIFIYFLSTSLFDTFYQVSSQSAFPLSSRSSK